MQIREVILEDFKKQDLVNAIEDFLPVAMTILKLKSLPKVIPCTHVPDKTQPTFGKYVHNKKVIYLAIKDRHIVDILRTFAHELVHYKQDIDGRLDKHSGETGSPIENEAHEIAGIIMRNFNKKHSHYFNISAVTLNEVTRRDMLTGLLGLGLGAAGAGVGRMLTPEPPKQTQKIEPVPTPSVPEKPEPPKEEPPMTDEERLENILKQEAEKQGITGVELVQLLAQAAHETMGYTRLEELGKRSYFRRYDPYHYPTRARRLGNTKRGDGERYKGRGFLQITGRYNYRIVGEAIGEPLEEKPELLLNPEIAAKASVWYWKERVQPRVQNFHDVKKSTKPINPGLKGLRNRQDQFDIRIAQGDETSKSS